MPHVSEKNKQHFYMWICLQRPHAYGTVVALKEDNREKTFYCYALLYLGNFEPYANM